MGQYTLHCAKELYFLTLPATSLCYIIQESLNNTRYKQFVRDYKSVMPVRLISGWCSIILLFNMSSDFAIVQGNSGIIIFIILVYWNHHQVTLAHNIELSANAESLPPTFISAGKSPCGVWNGLPGIQEALQKRSCVTRAWHWVENLGSIQGETKCECNGCLNVSCRGMLRWWIGIIGGQTKSQSAWLICCKFNDRLIHSPLKTSLHQSPITFEVNTVKEQ